MTTTTATKPPRATGTSRWLKQNRGKLALAAFFAFVVFSALFTMDTNDWFITIIRGLAVGAITFLVASGLSLIFGLMDVLSLAHGEFYMLGAYVGWTIYVRPDTFLDILTPVALVLSALALLPLWRHVASRWPRGKWPRIITPIVIGLAGLAIVLFLFAKFPLSIWDLEVYTDTPINNAVALDQGVQEVPPPAGFDGISPLVGIIGIWLGGALLGLGIAGGVERKAEVTAPLPGRSTYVIAACCRDSWIGGLRR